MSDPELAQLVLLNDDDHGYLYVINLLQAVCGLTPHAGFELARQIDATGRAVVFVGPRGEAEAKLAAVRAFGPDPDLDRSTGPLEAFIEPWDGDPVPAEVLPAEPPPEGAPPVGWSVGQAVVTGAALTFAAEAGAADRVTPAHVALAAILGVLAAGLYLLDRDRGTVTFHLIGALVILGAGLVALAKLAGGVG